jgi:hypothetical protein
MGGLLRGDAAAVLAICGLELLLRAGLLLRNSELETFSNGVIRSLLSISAKALARR